jgi:exopolysaccharide biosynthesis polyprenyl glycosylphosphotransferase
MVPVEEIGAEWLFSARLELAHPYYYGVKRAVDFLAGLAGLLLTAPVMIVAMILIKYESPGPAVYSQIRVGQFGRQFRIYKLRSMVQDAEKNGAQWAAQRDGRITKLGRFLRRTRLDEAPQFWNILKGEMSLVGPRPERPEFVDQLRHRISFFVQRHLVKPGLTGWAQINYPYGASIEDTRNKLKYDLFYIKRASIGLDIQIILRTIGAMMKGSR